MASYTGLGGGGGWHGIRGFVCASQITWVDRVNRVKYVEFWVVGVKCQLLVVSCININALIFHFWIEVKS